MRGFGAYYLAPQTVEDVLTAGQRFSMPAYARQPKM